MVPRIFCLSRATGCGDPNIWGPNWLGIKSGDHFSRGTGSPRIKWVWDQMRRGQNFRFWGIFLAGTLLDNRLVDLPLSYPLLVYKIQTFFIPEKNLVGKPEVVQMLRSPKSGSLFWNSDWLLCFLESQSEGSLKQLLYTGCLILKWCYFFEN